MYDLQALVFSSLPVFQVSIYGSVIHHCKKNKMDSNKSTMKIENLIYIVETMIILARMQSAKVNKIHPTTVT